MLIRCYPDRTCMVSARHDSSVWDYRTIQKSHQSSHNLFLKLPTRLKSYRLSLPSPTVSQGFFLAAGSSANGVYCSFLDPDPASKPVTLHGIIWSTCGLIYCFFFMTILLRFSFRHEYTRHDGVCSRAVPEGYRSCHRPCLGR